MPKYVTKDVFDGGIATIRQEIRDLVKEIRGGFSSVNEEIKFLKVEMKEVRSDLTLTKAAVLETAGTEQHLLNLIDQLRKHGIPIEDSEVYKRK